MCMKRAMCLNIILTQDSSVICNVILWGLSALYSISGKSTFSSVAAFESGYCGIDPDLLNGIMAASSGDSIFVAAPFSMRSH